MSSGRAGDQVLSPKVSASLSPLVPAPGPSAHGRLQSLGLLHRHKQGTPSLARTGPGDRPATHRRTQPCRWIGRENDLGTRTAAESTCAPGPWSEPQRGAGGRGRWAVPRKASARRWEYATLQQGPDEKQVTRGNGAFSSLSQGGPEGNAVSSGALRALRRWARSEVGP